MFKERSTVPARVLVLQIEEILKERGMKKNLIQSSTSCTLTVHSVAVMLSTPNFPECLSIQLQEAPLLTSQSRRPSEKIHTQPRHLRVHLESSSQPTSRSLCTIVSSHHAHALWPLCIPYCFKNSTVSEGYKPLFFIMQYHWDKSYFQESVSKTILEGFNTLFLSRPSPFI